MFLLIGIIFAATVAQLRELHLRKSALAEELERVTRKVDGLIRENTDLEASITYLKTPENLIKEARAQLHYGAPGERLIVVVPKKSN